MENLSRTSSEIFAFRLQSFMVLYFLQGLPYGIQTRFLPLHLRASGMSLTHLGYFRMLLAPWVLKGLWAPIIDRTGDVEKYLNASHVSLVILCLITTQFSPAHVLPLGVLLFFIHLSVAVQDIALDGLLIELLTPSQLVVGNMVQVVGYKLGTIFSGGFFSFMTEIVGWEILFFILALMYAFGYVVAKFYLPDSNTVITRPPITVRSHRMSLAGYDESNRIPLELSSSQADVEETGYSILHLFDIHGTAWLTLFVFVYKFGDQGLSSMFPMFLIDSGVDMAEVSFWTGCIGQIFSISGSILGGLIRNTMIESIHILLVVQAASLIILLTAVIFWDNSTNYIYIGSLFVLMIAYLASGGVSTCTFTLIMQLSQTVPRRFRTQHYTMLATSEVAGRLLSSSIAGILTDWTSYTFTFSILVGVSVLIIPFVMWVPRALRIES